LITKHVAISGGFDPLTIGHVRYIQEAAKLGTKLTVILNSDDFLFRKKGYVFMEYNERKEILEAIKGVDEVFKCIDLDDTVRKTLLVLHPDIFAKGGDRIPSNIPEYKMCTDMGIKMIFGVGGSDKPQSSSWLVEKAAVKLFNIKESKKNGMRRY
jgi:D-beta-D-heptose 7-phosphate kinase/D-beta-D-heptose 1-phosphate adenosyltransferase